jgi:hypothetical protein
MRTTLPWLATPALLLLFAACGTTDTPTLTGGVLAAAKGTDRPFTGSCTLTVAARVHDDEEGGCGGGEDHEGDEGGGPPIPRHYELAGSCQLTHLGRAAVSGRMNLSGPFQAGHVDGNGQAALMARGRLLFTAANGDAIAGRYIPISASFTPASGGDGGTVLFRATQEFGESCEGGGHGGMGGGEEGEDHEEPESSGRFAAALGQAALDGRLVVSGLTGQGSGTLLIPHGLISY